MIILGITQTNHGSSAAVYDGRKMLATSEERFDRVKNSSWWPRFGGGLSRCIVCSRRGISSKREAA